MSVLKPYIDSGKLVVRSKQMTMAQIATLRWDGALAQSRMDNLLSAYYSGDNLDAVLSPYDGISIGIISSLKGIGYGKPNKPLPVITGRMRNWLPSSPLWLENRHRRSSRIHVNSPRKQWRWPTAFCRKTSRG